MKTPDIFGQPCNPIRLPGRNSPIRQPMAPTVTEKFTAQQLRQAALKWQLVALHAQAQAIAAIAQEHRIVIDDLGADSLCARANDIILTAQDIQDKVHKRDLASTLQ